MRFAHRRPTDDMGGATSFLAQEPGFASRNLGGEQLDIPLKGIHVLGCNRLRKNMKYRRGVVPLCVALSACANNPLPPPNGVRATFDRSAQAIELVISNAQAPHDAALVGPDGTRYPLVLTLVSGPHVNYSAPPSVGLGLGGFGGGVGGGLGFGVPLGSPHPTGVDDQYVVSTRFVAPPDYPQRWAQYRIEFQVGGQRLAIPAPSSIRS